MQESDIKPGDGIFFNTGWGSLWKKNNDKFNSGEPGIGLEVANWVIEKDLCLTGADTWAVEAVPNPDKTRLPGPHDAADQARNCKPRELVLRRFDRGQEISVRLRLHAGANRGCDRLAGRTDPPDVNNAITAGSSEPAVIGAIPDFRSVLLAWLCAGVYEAGR